METAIHNSDSVFIDKSVEEEVNKQVKKDESIESLVDDKGWQELVSHIDELVNALESSLDRVLETELSAQVIGQKFQAVRTATHYLKYVRNLPKNLREATEATE